MQLPNTPNLQDALETTIPTLSGILIGFTGALFVAAAITDNEEMAKEIGIFPFVFIDNVYFLIPFNRQYWIMALSALPVLFFYRSINKCILAQMTHYDKSKKNYPDINYSAEEIDIEVNKKFLEERIKEWEKNRQESASLALILFNLGTQSTFLPLIFLLPPEIFSLAFYIFFLSLILFIKKWKQSSTQVKGSYWNIFIKLFIT